MASGEEKKGGNPVGKPRKKRKRICYVPPNKRKKNISKVKGKTNNEPKRIKKKLIYEFDGNESSEMESETVTVATNPVTITTTSNGNSHSDVQLENESVAMTTDPVAMTTEMTTSIPNGYTLLIPKPIVMTTVAMDTWQPVSLSAISVMRSVMESNIK